MRGVRPDLPYIDAVLALTRTEVGGRRGPIRSGFRIDRDIGQVQSEDGRPWLFAGPVDLADQEELGPGETGTVRIHPLSLEFWRHLRVGSEIRMVEGTKEIGAASVRAMSL